MKVLTKILAAVALLFAMASCGNPVENAKKAIEEGDLVKAAECLSKVSVSDVQNMSEEELNAFQEAVVALGLGSWNLSASSSDEDKEAAAKIEELLKDFQPVLEAVVEKKSELLENEVEEAVDALKEAGEDLNEELQSAGDKAQEAVDKVKEDVNNVKESVDNVKEDVNKVKEDVNNVKETVKSLGL